MEIPQTLAGLAAAIRSGGLSPAEAVDAYLKRIERLDPSLNAFISVQGEEALARARAIERQRGARGPLYGVPLAVKDLIDVKGVPTTAASRILADNVAGEPAEVVRRLEEAGAIVVGKLNTHEFAYGPMTTSQHFGRARNPWDTARVTGGSSGGSGAAAAAGLVAGTLGTDTAGSIRIPAAFAGSAVSARRAASFRRVASCRSPGRSTRSGQSLALPRTVRCSWRRSRDMIQATRRRSTFHGRAQLRSGEA